MSDARDETDDLMAALGGAVNRSVDDFDRYCETNSITPHERPAAFAAWLAEAGWGGDVRKVEDRE